MSDTSASLKGKILSGDRALSQGQLLANVARAATGLSALGIGAEDTVAIMIRNDFPFFEASMAARAVGARSMPINWHYQAEEAGYILRDSQAKALVVHADLLPQVRATIPTSVQTLVVPTPPEIQAAYGISPQQSTPPQDLLEWCVGEPSEATRTDHASGTVKHVLHRGHNGNPEGRTTRAPY